MVGLVCAVLLALGWSAREELYFLPEDGLGYRLGIVGLSMMVLLLAYSARKRLPLMRSWGNIRWWFHVHLMLGLLGPTLILFHANFRLGSTNSAVALVSTLLVAGSGVLGRLLYTQIHHGLSGRRTTLAEIRGDADARFRSLGEALRAEPVIAERLRAFEHSVLSPAPGVLPAAWGFLRLGGRRRATYRACRRALSRAARGGAGLDRRRALAGIRAYLGAVVRVARFGTYERIFSLWHVLHLPLCVLLFGAAAVHVVAVHMY